MVANWGSVPQLTPCLVSLGGAFNTRFPGRDQASDGAWGDAAHKLSPSGHNPDGTPGSRPEYEDNDGRPEIRAIDVDADLRGASMGDVVDAIVASDADRGRLSYIIFDGLIAGDHTGWRWVTYTGDNPHRAHAHFSGKASKDADGAPFRSVLDYGSGEGDDLSVKASKLIESLARPIGTRGLEVLPEPNSPLRNIEQIRDIKATADATHRLVSELLAAVAKLAAAVEKMSAGK